jgi:hypothetical protein
MPVASVLISIGLTFKSPSDETCLRFLNTEGLLLLKKQQSTITCT